MSQIEGPQVLENVPFELDVGDLLRRLHIAEESDDAREAASLVDVIHSKAKPKALYRICAVEERGDDTVVLDGVTFTSLVLRSNLDEVQRVFAYIATCGAEVDDLDLAAGDFLKQYWLDEIKAVLLAASIRHLQEHLKTRYALGKTASMSPGSGEATVWPIDQQRELFSLLGNVRDLIGVELTESCLMMPNKSVSGVRFRTEVDFRTCQLCQREDCPSRSAPFDQHLWDSYQHGLT